MKTINKDVYQCPHCDFVSIDKAKMEAHIAKCVIKEEKSKKAADRYKCIQSSTLDELDTNIREYLTKYYPAYVSELKKHDVLYTISAVIGIYTSGRVTIDFVQPVKNIFNIKDFSNIQKLVRNIDIKDMEIAVDIGTKDIKLLRDEAFAKYTDLDSEYDKLRETIKYSYVQNTLKEGLKDGKDI